MKWSILVISATRIAAKEIFNADFRVSIDDTNGAVIGVFDPQATNSSMNWVSSNDNAPWQPLSSRWGLGFYDGGDHSLQRHFWKNPTITCKSDTSCTAIYNTGALELRLERTVDGAIFTERYTFKNLKNEVLDLSQQGVQSFAIYTPFNDHYTNTTDSLTNRAHAHI